MGQSLSIIIQVSFFGMVQFGTVVARMSVEFESYEYSRLFGITIIGGFSAIVTFVEDS